MAYNSLEFSKGTVTIRNLPEVIRGCGVEPKDEHIHLGMLFKRVTACGKDMGEILLADEVTINCPDCVTEINHRKAHPDAAKQEFGVVTHKPG